MVLPRPTALRALNVARFARSTPRTAVRSRVQTVARRGYASGGDGHAHAPSSDMPWLISAIAVTIPSVYFLWPEASHGDAHGAHGAHEEEHEEEPAEEPKEEEEAKEEPAEESKEQDAPKDDAPKEDAAPAEESKDESKDGEPKKEDAPKDDKPDQTEGEHTSNKKVDGVQFKGKTTAGDDNNEMTDTRKREPDSKGAFKKRIDSHYQKDLGEAAANDSADDKGSVSNKQKGLSNTPTRHSTAIHEDPEKSKKSEGTPDTAKTMGPVDPNRSAK